MVVRDDTGTADAIKQMRRELDDIRSLQQASLKATNIKYMSELESIRKRIEQATEFLRDEIHEQLGNATTISKLEQNVGLISSKLQEFDDMSVDIDEVDKIYMTKDELKKALGTPKQLRRTIEKYTKKTDKISNKLQDMEEEKHRFASHSSLKHLQEEMIEVRNSLIRRHDLEIMNSRIDKIEDRMHKRMDRIDKSVQRIEDNLVSALALKKDFISKTQYENLRKEIKLLVQGIKEMKSASD